METHSKVRLDILMSSLRFRALRYCWTGWRV